MKKMISAFLAIIVVFSLSIGAFASELHTESRYLTDTLTLAGSGFDSMRTLPVSAVESLSSTDLGYENAYSTMTSGSVFSKHSFKGIKLYDLLLHEGLDASMPDSTVVNCISKDGYTIPLSLGDLRSDRYGRYSEKGGVLEESGLPVLVAFASDGESLVGPTGTESVYKKFGAAEGYIEAADNIGGPLRLVIGQTDSYEFNAPNCAKWLSAIVVGDAGDYVYTRESEAALDNSEPDRSGDWTHQGKQDDYRLIIRGSEAKNTRSLSLEEIEAMDGKVREYYAASAGRNAFEGIPLKAIVSACLKEDMEKPTRITIKASDGFSKSLDVNAVFSGVDSFYQPGKHRDMLLAWAVDGSPLVFDKNSAGYDGINAYGPLRLVVENTISLWVKNVSEIILGEETEEAEIITRADYIVSLWQDKGTPVSNAEIPFVDVTSDMYCANAIRWAVEKGLILGYGDGRFGTYDLLKPEHKAMILERLVKIGGCA